MLSSAQLLAIATTTNAILGMIALALSLMAKRKHKISPCSVAFLYVTAHAALYYIVNSIARHAFGYVGPSLFFTSWGIALRTQYFLTVIGIMLLKLRED